MLLQEGLFFLLIFILNNLKLKKMGGRSEFAVEKQASNPPIALFLKISRI